ncbi:hypothetical protein HN937_24425 [Candidatus Poribacteria bacterium]|jgi:hypothetical protein|nr:hypothetical protein [Candidatus Poribacteria bacterium]
MITHRAHYVRHLAGTRALIDIVLVDGTARHAGSPVGHPVEHIHARNGYDLTPEQAAGDSLAEQLHRLGAKAAADQCPQHPAADGFDYDGKPTIAPAAVEVGAMRKQPPSDV